MIIEIKYIDLLGYYRLTINGTDYRFWNEKQVMRTVRKLTKNMKPAKVNKPNINAQLVLLEMRNACKHSEFFKGTAEIIESKFPSLFSKTAQQ